MEYQELSIPIWMAKHNLVNEKGEPLTFRDHLFLYDIYRDQHIKIVLKKCAQVGASVLMNIRAFHFARYRKLGVIYTMPSDSDISTFVETKTDKIFQSNAIIRDYIVRDTVTLKEVAGGTFIKFKGTRSQSAPIADTTDILIQDEVDRSDQNILEQYESRLSASKYQGIWKLSNPSLINIGIDADWKNSDQKEWFITCACGFSQILSWDDNVDAKTKLFVCKKCGGEVTDQQRRLGVWKAKNPGHPVSGYHISQLMASWISAERLLNERENKGAEYFQNFVLGEPYYQGDTQNFRQMIYDSWTSKPLMAAPLFMGVDVGKVKHWALGGKDGIFRIGTAETREEIEDLIEKYNPLTVMDAGPERTWAEEFRKKYPRLYLCFYKRDSESMRAVEWGGLKGSPEDLKKVGTVRADRTRTIDETLASIQKGDIQFSISREDLEKYIKHWESMARIVEVDAIGRKRYAWVSQSGVDHFAHATNYYNMARQRNSVEITSSGENRERQPITMATKDGFVMRDLEEIVEEQRLYDQ